MRNHSGLTNYQGPMVMGHSQNQMRKCCKMNSQSGFSMMELMVSIALIAVLASVATPNVIAWRNNAQFNSAVRQVKSNIEGMRMFAIKNNLRAAVAFTDGADSFDTITWDRAAGAPGAPNTYQLAPDIRVSSNFGGDQLIFNSRGMANTIGTVTIQNTAGLSRLITVSLVGSSRIQ